jgi:hypothetical protein
VTAEIISLEHYFASDEILAAISAGEFFSWPQPPKSCMQEMGR